MVLSSLLSPIFPSRPIADQGAFEDYIKAAIPTFMYSTYWPLLSTVQCFFSTSLSTSDQTLLQQKINDYGNPAFVPPAVYYYSATGMDTKTSNNISWTTIFTFAHQGSLPVNMGALTAFKVRSYLVPSLVNDSGSSNFYYDLQVVDDNGTVLASNRYTNSSETTYSMPVSNPPSAPCFLRLQTRKGLAGNYIQLTTFCAQYDIV